MKAVKLPNGDYYILASHAKDFDFNISKLTKVEEGYFYVGKTKVVVPFDWIGKKVRLKIEVVEDGKKR